MQIYCIFRSKHLSHACIQLEVHSYPVVDGQCREYLEAISGLIAHKLARTPSAIALAAIKKFLNTFFIHCGHAPKVILHGDALEYVMDKLYILSSCNVRNMISSFWNDKKGDKEIDCIVDLKGRAKIE